MKAERQLETSDKNQKNKSTLMDNFRILLEEKHNDADYSQDKDKVFGNCAQRRLKWGAKNK